MDSNTQQKKSITLAEIEMRFVDPSIIRKMVTGYFERANNPAAPVEDHVLTISCVDSRLPPAKVLGLEHGQAYSIQTVANVVPKLDTSIPYDDQPIEVAAGLEYAVAHKGVNRILIMGHTDCGGAEARLIQPTSLPNVNRWMSHVCLDNLHAHGNGAQFTALLEEVKRTSPFLYSAARGKSEEECLRTSARNIRSMPFIKDAVTKTGLSIAKLICDIKEGKLDIRYTNRSATPAIEDVLDRFRSFKEEAWGPDGYMHDLAANGQHPKALIVTGISPYVAPEVNFGIEPGDTFIHRRIGGQYHHDRTPGGMAATIEFAIKAKGVPSLIFVGHRNDVNRDYAEGKMDRFELTRGFMEKCVPDILQWRESGMHPDRMHEKSMKSTLFNAKKHEAVKEAEKAGKLTVAAILVDHEHGTMEFYDPQTDEFLQVIPPSM